MLQVRPFRTVMLLCLATAVACEARDDPSSGAALVVQASAPDSTGGVVASAGSNPAQQAASPATFTPADFQRLRWLEGAWRGRGPGGPPFHERLAFVDDSTIEMTYYADSTLTSATGRGLVALREGRIIHEDRGARWRAVNSDLTDLQFAPVSRASNHFRWTYESADRWIATLVSASGRETVYRLERLDG